MVFLPSPRGSKYESIQVYPRVAYTVQYEYYNILIRYRGLDASTKYEYVSAREGHRGTGSCSMRVFPSTKYVGLAKGHVSRGGFDGFRVPQPMSR